MRPATSVRPRRPGASPRRSARRGSRPGPPRQPARPRGGQRAGPARRPDRRTRIMPSPPLNVARALELLQPAERGHQPHRRGHGPAFGVQPRAEVRRQRARDVARQAAAGHVGDAAQVVAGGAEGTAGVQHAPGIDACRCQQHLADALHDDPRLRREGRVTTRVAERHRQLHLVRPIQRDGELGEERAHEREPVGVQAGGRQAEDQVARRAPRCHRGGRRARRCRGTSPRGRTCRAPSGPGARPSRRRRARSLPRDSPPRPRRRVLPPPRDRAGPTAR